MKFRFLSAAFTIIMMSVSSFTASAGLIVGSHTTDLGKNVNLGGLEWHTWHDLTNISRTTMLSEMQSGGLYDGWRYAKKSDFNLLFDSLWGEEEGSHAANIDRSNWLNNNFGSTQMTSLNGDVSYGFWIAYGSIDEVGSSDTAFFGLYSIDQQINGSKGVFSRNLGVGGGYDFTNIFNDDIGNGPIQTHALVRVSQVPEPSTLAIFALGLMGLASRRFKKQS